MKLGDLVMERNPPFLIKGADYGLIIRELEDKWFTVLWDDGIKRKCFELELFKVSTTWSNIDEDWRSR